MSPSQEARRLLVSAAPRSRGCGIIQGMAAAAAAAAAAATAGIYGLLLQWCISIAAVAYWMAGLGLDERA